LSPRRFLSTGKELLRADANASRTRHADDLAGLIRSQANCFTRAV
jgi:hypothetical protein